MSARQRARELGVPLGGTPAAANDIADVPGVLVGHATVIRGDGPRIRGAGPVRTGVTAILPRGRDDHVPVRAAVSVLNGTGELTGAHMVAETGLLYGPIMLTNTNSVGVVRDAVTAWLIDHDPGFTAALPMVGETWDGELNDIDGFHIQAQDAITAIEQARGSPVAQGVVGAGTGTICFDYKGGIGSASRRIGDYTVGALVQTNHGLAHQLTIAGVPVGRELAPDARPPSDSSERGSLVMVIATDVPAGPDQLARLARRAALGLARTGAVSGPFSGDFAIAFSTAAAPAGRFEAPPLGSGLEVMSHPAVDGAQLGAVFTAVIEVVEEAIIDSLFTACTTTGANGLSVPALPTEQVLAILTRYRRSVSAG